MNWKIIWSERARRDVRRLDPAVTLRVVGAIERLAEAGIGDVRRLQGYEDQWRLRVGAFTLDPENSSLLIIRVLPRGNAYRR